MSRTSFADSGCIQRRPVTVGNFEEVRVGRVTPAHEVNASSKQLFEVCLQGEEPVSDPIHISRIEFVEQVDVASRQIKVVARGRAEQFQPTHAVLPAQRSDLPAVSFDKFKHNPIILFRHHQAKPFITL
jgi:hypothetical protein